MSEENSRKSRATAWTLAVIVAIPLLYVLSYGPAAGLYTNGSIRREWLGYYAPVDWLHGKIEKTPLGKLFVEYMDWWIISLDKPRD